MFSNDVTAAILVSQNNETAAMLVSQTGPLGVEFFSYASHVSGNTLKRGEVVIISHVAMEQNSWMTTNEYLT